MAKVFNLKILVPVLLPFALCGCASQGGAPESGNAMASSAAVAGCRIDAASICDSMRGKPIDMAGLHGSQRMLEANGPRTSELVVPIRMPNGDPIVEVRCGINTQAESVIYANLMPGAPLTKEKADYLRGMGLCSVR